tara:strand:+ start:1141 stop:2073 length:933 start_codon:yes stop_codon:yes gene_type:complete
MSNTNFMQIFQVYYNWLYSRSGSGYILDDNFEDLKDVQTCPPELTLFLLSNYLPDSLKFAIQVNGLITPQTIRNFLYNVKPRFVDGKGTDNSVKYFCNTLLGASFTETEVVDGNLLVVKLFFQDNITLNERVRKNIADYISKHIVPASSGYFVEVSTDQTNLNQTNSQLRSGDDKRRDNTVSNENIPKFNEWEIAVFGEGAYDGTGTGEEISIIGNYFPYTIGDTLSIESTAGCSGSTLHSGITGGATGNTYTNMTTYAFPDWSDAVNISGSSFGILNIYDFAFLSAASGNTSPNDGRETSGSCPIGGYA